MSEMHNPPHPGEVLRKWLAEISVTEAAKRWAPAGITAVICRATRPRPRRAFTENLSTPSVSVAVLLINLLIYWRSLRDSNPCYRLERAMS